MLILLVIRFAEIAEIIGGVLPAWLRIVSTARSSIFFVVFYILVDNREEVLGRFVYGPEFLESGRWNLILFRADVVKKSGRFSGEGPSTKRRAFGNFFI